MENNASSDNLEDKLQWIQPEEYYSPITPLERLKRRMLINPLVPIGVCGTVTVLVLGIRSMLKGDSRRSQIMMRWRVGLQAATFAVMFAGLYVEYLLSNKENK